VSVQHPLRLTALLSLLAYVGGAAAVFGRRPRAGRLA
jgi:hypothetical protein